MPKPSFTKQFIKLEGLFALVAILITFSLALEGARDTKYYPLVISALEYIGAYGENLGYDQKVVTFRDVNTGEITQMTMTVSGSYVKNSVPPVGTIIGTRRIEQIETNKTPFGTITYALITSIIFIGFTIFWVKITETVTHQLVNARSFLRGTQILKFVYSVLLLLIITVLLLNLLVIRVLKLSTIFASWLAISLDQPTYYTILALFVLISGLLAYGNRHNINKNEPKNDTNTGI